ncbi:MAG: hypothetical protein RIC52_11290, partial [Amphiplicatus sp.]
ARRRARGPSLPNAEALSAAPAEMSSKARCQFMNASLLDEWRNKQDRGASRPFRHSYQAHLAEKLLKERQFQAVE